jgi:hypothetical protein
VQKAHGLQPKVQQWRSSDPCFSSGQVKGWLDYIPGKDVFSPEAWKANDALTVYKLLKNLKQAAKLYPLLDPKTSGRFIADWQLVEDYLARSAMDTYPGGQGAANVAVCKNVNDLLHTYFIKLLTPYWPRIEKALNVLEYDDDTSLLHVRNALGNITERMPLVPLLITKLKEKTYKGPVVHNKSLEDQIQGFKGPKDASDLALATILAWLDSTDMLWSMIQAYPECLATEGQRWTELLRQIKNWSTNDPNKFPTDIFINEMREKAKSTGVKSLSDLISSFSEWIETEILERQASQSKKAISVNATTTGGGCKFHGPQAKHTTEMCLGKGLGKRPQEQQDQRGKAKNGRWMNAQQLNRGRNFNSVRFNQDKGAPGHSSQKPEYQGSNGGHHGPKHQGGSLEELLMKNLSGGYKGKHFDPAKSKKYNALMTYFQNNGQSATGAPPIPSNGASAAGQASANAALTASLPFAFAMTIAEDSGFDSQFNPQEEEQEPLPKSTQCCEGQLMLDQEDRVVHRVIRVAERVGDLEDLGAAQLSTLTRLHPKEYHKRYEDSLTRISDALNGYTEFDAQVTTDIFENDLAQTDNIFKNFSSGDIKDNCERRLQLRDVFGDDCTDPSDFFESESEYNFDLFEEEDLDSNEAGTDLRPITSSQSPPSRRHSAESSDESEERRLLKVSTQCPTKGKTSQYNCYMLTHRLQTTPGSHFAIVDSGTPIHIVFDHLYVSNTREDHTPVTGFSGNASRAHKGDMNARVRTNNNEYINLVDVNSTLVVPDCVRRLYSVRQATHKGYKVLLDSHKPGLWECEHFIPFVNDPDTNLWLLPLFPPTSKDNGIYPIPSYNAAALPKPAIDIPDEL